MVDSFADAYRRYLNGSPAVIRLVPQIMYKKMLVIPSEAVPTVQILTFPEGGVKSCVLLSDVPILFSVIRPEDLDDYVANETCFEHKGDESEFQLIQELPYTHLYAIAKTALASGTILLYPGL